MPNRILKESICTSEEVDKLTAFQETVFYRLIVNCDDHGRMDARPKILASKLFPLKDLRANQISDALRALTSAELVDLYEVDGKPFLQMRTWDRHQQIRAQKSKYPAPDDGNQLQSIDINCNQLQSDDIKCSRNPIQSNIESESNTNTNSDPRKRFTPPTADEVRSYCHERKNNIDPEYFVAYYTARDWVLNNGKKMKDWKAAVITWEKNNYSKPDGGKKVTAQDYDQRDYTATQDDARNRMKAMMEAAGYV